MNSKYSKVYPISAKDKQFSSSKLTNSKKKNKNQEDSGDDENEGHNPGKKGRKGNYEDSDCSSSIHSDDRIIQEIKNGKDIPVDDEEDEDKNEFEGKSKKNKEIIQVEVQVQKWQAVARNSLFVIDKYAIKLCKRY